MVIVFEGPERTGKSTQLKLLARALKKRKLKTKVLHTSSLLGGDVTRMKVDKSIKFFLYLASIRAATLKMQEALDRGQIILVDRYIYSNAAFTPLMNLNPAAMQIVEDYKAFAIRPTLIFYVDGQQFGKDWLTEEQRAQLRQYYKNCLPLEAIAVNNKYSIKRMHQHILKRVLEKLKLKGGSNEHSWD